MRILSVILVCFISVFAKAQETLSLNFNLFSTNQQIVSDATKGGIVIVSQSYQLEDTITHQRFGRYGNLEFGKGFSVGVKVPNGIIVTNEYIEPWNTDVNFYRYRNSHKPVRFKQQARELNDSVIREKYLDVSSAHSLYISKLYLLQDTTVDIANGIAIDTLPGDKEGWMLWLVSDNVIEAADSVYNESFIIHKKTLTVSTDSLEIKIDAPNTEKKVWGGIYIVPKQTAVGQITFLLSGIAIKDMTGKWSVVMPFLNSAPTSIAEPVNDLTPINPEITKDDDSHKVKDKKIKKRKTKKNG